MTTTANPRVGMTVGDVCTRDVVVCSPETAIRDAAALMREHHVGDVVVVARKGSELRAPVGIVTDRDLVVGVLARDVEHIPKLAVGDVMTQPVVTLGEDDPLDRAIATMKTQGVRRLPVVAPSGVLVGILTADDVLDALAEQLTSLAGVIAHESNRERRTRR